MTTLDSPTMDEELRKVWRKPFHKSSVAKDLPRLAGRTSIEAPIQKRMSSFLSTLRLSRVYGEKVDLGDTDNVEVVMDNPQLSPSNENSTAHHVRTVIIEVARNVETRERFDVIKRELEKTKFNSDWELEMRDLFHELIGEDSKTAKVFKAITQNVLFVGCLEIKTKVPNMSMTRDVRGPEGWKILVTFAKDTVSVTHYRREQSLATAPANEQFWFEWRLSMIFDKDMNDMQASSLKITNLGFSEQTVGIFRSDLTRLLGGGNLIVG